MTRELTDICDGCHEGMRDGAMCVICADVFCEGCAYECGVCKEAFCKKHVIARNVLSSVFDATYTCHGCDAVSLKAALLDVQEAFKAGVLKPTYQSDLHLVGAEVRL